MKTKVLLATALIISLTINVVATLKSGREEQRRQDLLAEQEEETARWKTAYDKCWRRKHKSVKADFRKLLSHGTRTGLFSSGETSPGPVKKPAPVVLPNFGIIQGEVNDALLQSVLCEVAKKQMLGNWREKKEELVTSLRKSLSNREKQLKDLQGNIDKMASHLGMDGNTKELFAKQYTPLRRAALEKIYHEISNEGGGIDFSHVLGAVKSLYKGEDNLAQQLMGGEGRRRLRFMMLEERTTIISIVSALGNLALEEQYHW